MSLKLNLMRCNVANSSRPPRDSIDRLITSSQRNTASILETIYSLNTSDESSGFKDRDPLYENTDA